MCLESKPRPAGLCKLKMKCWTLLRASTVLLLSLVLVSAAQKPRPKNKSGRLMLALKAETSALTSQVKRTAAVIQHRCVRFNIRCRIQTHDPDNPNHISIRFSSVNNIARVKALLLGQGFQVRAVDSKPFPEALREYQTRAEATDAAGDKEVFPLPEGGRETFLVVDGAKILTGDDLRDCVVLRDRNQPTYSVDCRLKPAGAARLEAWTSANINSYAAVVFNGKAVSVAYIVAPISLNMEISGIFGLQQAREIAHILESGNLPAPFDIVHEEISP